jgi:hypothetical protein
MNPFDVITDLSLTKAGTISAANEKDYAPFMVNRGFSYFIDTLFYAQEMNVHHQCDKLMQYDYYFNQVRKKKRFSRWAKKNADTNIELVAEYYNYGQKRAEEACKLLTKEQIAHIKDYLTKGKK